MVLQRVVHGPSSSVLCHKDSEDSRGGGEIVQFFCHAVHGDGLVKRREVAFCAGVLAIGKGLDNPLPVDAVVYAERVPALSYGVHLVERGVGDVLVGKVVGDKRVGPHLGHGVGVGGMLIAVHSHPVLLRDVAVRLVTEGVFEVRE